MIKFSKKNFLSNKLLCSDTRTIFLKHFALRGFIAVVYWKFFDTPLPYIAHITISPPVGVITEYCAGLVREVE